MAEVLSNLSDAVRTVALERFHIIRPFLEEGVPLPTLAQHHALSLRTARRWVQLYRAGGLGALGRKRRVDKGARRALLPQLTQVVEALALKKPAPSVATIHRKVAAIATEQGVHVPSYDVVHDIVRQIDPALVTLAHEGSKAYSATFELLYRREADAPNAIWRKADASWQVCGIPRVLYTDHGSDFTFHHLEQVCADLHIQPIFSLVGQPRGRGRIERFFNTVNQELLARLPGYAPAGFAMQVQPVLTLQEFTHAWTHFVLQEYHQRPHSATGCPPQARWSANGFLPQMPESLEQLDLLLLTMASPRSVHRDGIRFQALRYIDPTLAAYVGEHVMIRYDPRDMAEIRVYHQERFLCRAVCQELAGETVGLKDIIQARRRRKRELQHHLRTRQSLVDQVLAAVVPAEGTGAVQGAASPHAEPRGTLTLKRYHNESIPSPKLANLGGLLS